MLGLNSGMMPVPEILHEGEGHCLLPLFFWLGAPGVALIVSCRDAERLVVFSDPRSQDNAITFSSSWRGLCGCFSSEI